VSKKILRKKKLILRKKKFKTIKIKLISIKKIFKLFNLKSNIKIGGYYPINHEIDSLVILKKLFNLGYKISLPVIKENNQMDFFDWSFDNPLRVGKMGIPEPFQIKKIYPDVILVPLVAFDKYNYRLGYGGGYYDRYIEKINKIKKILTIGLAFSFQKVNKLSVNEHDKKLDFILSER
tara:strand:- start:94 stop:627 length:534 start_codon:yes stop_codon:yes gene_type:complete